MDNINIDKVIIHKARVCIPCREQKRKCNKVQPVCSLCARIGRKCHWDTPPSPNLGAGPSPVTPVPLAASDSESTADAKSPSDSHSVPILDLLSNPHNLAQTLTIQLCRITSNGARLPSVIAKYMRTIQPYFPVVSPDLPQTIDPHLLKVFLALRLGSPVIPSCTDASTPLFFLSLVLITNSVPSLNPSVSNLNSESEPIEAPGLCSDAAALHTLLKAGFAILEGELDGPDSRSRLMGLQARALVTLFEVGHGCQRAAWISIAALARAVEGAGCASGEWGEMGQKLWWGVVVLDRYISLEAGKGPRVTAGLGQTGCLPGEPDADGEAGMPTPFTTRPLKIPISPSPNAVPFERLAQASHILDLVLAHVRSPLVYLVTNVDIGVELLQSSTAFNVVLVVETTPVTALYSGAVGMIHAAIISIIGTCLAYPLPDHSQDVIDNARDCLRPLFHEMVSSCSAFLSSTSTPSSPISDLSYPAHVDIESVSPFIPYSLFKAACMIIDDECKDGAEWCQRALAILKNTLERIGGRWDAGRRYTEMLNLYECEQQNMRKKDDTL